MSNRIFYPAFALSIGPSPATGFHFNTGFNGAFTGLGSGGNNLIQNLERLQSITNGLSQDRTIINQLGQLSFISREITTPPTVNLGATYYVADLSNERILGFNVSGQGALGPILDQTQATKNYFVSIAPEGIDNVAWTGNRQVELISNGQLASWSTEGSVGNIPTTTFSIQGLNYATYTGSTVQQLLAIDVGNNGEYVTNKYFTIPTVVSGIAPTVAALRPNDISLSISNAAIGLSISDLKAQSYSISFDLNVQPLNKLGSLFPYAILPTFPVALNATASFYVGDLITGSYKSVLCADTPYNLRFVLNDPCGGGEAVAYELNGMKVDSQSFDSQDIGSVAAVVNLNWSSQLGSATDTRVNLLMSGRNI